MRNEGRAWVFPARRAGKDPYENGRLHRSM